MWTNHSSPGDPGQRVPVVAEDPGEADLAHLGELGGPQHPGSLVPEPGHQPITGQQSCRPMRCRHRPVPVPDPPEGVHQEALRGHPHPAPRHPCLQHQPHPGVDIIRMAVQLGHDTNIFWLSTKIFLLLRWQTCSSFCRASLSGIQRASAAQVTASEAGARPHQRSQAVYPGSPWSRPRWMLSAPRSSATVCAT